MGFKIDTTHTSMEVIFHSNKFVCITSCIQEETNEHGEHMTPRSIFIIYNSNSSVQFPQSTVVHLSAEGDRLVWSQ